MLINSDQRSSIVSTYSTSSYYSPSCYRRLRQFEPGIKSLHFLFGRPGDPRLKDIFSLEILTNLSATILVTCLSHSLLFSNRYWLDTTGFSDLVGFLFYIFLFCQLFSLILSSHLLSTFVWFFDVSVPFSKHNEI